MFRLPVRLGRAPTSAISIASPALSPSIWRCQTTTADCAFHTRDSLTPPKPIRPGNPGATGDASVVTSATGRCPPSRTVSPGSRWSSGTSRRAARRIGAAYRFFLRKLPVSSNHRNLTRCIGSPTPKQLRRPPSSHHKNRNQRSNVIPLRPLRDRRSPTRLQLPRVRPDRPNNPTRRIKQPVRLKQLPVAFSAPSCCATPTQQDQDSVAARLIRSRIVTVLHPKTAR